jgi:hypothetical protein
MSKPEKKKKKNIIKKIIPAATRSKYHNKKELIKQLENQLRDYQAENSDLRENINLIQESSEN